MKIKLTIEGEPASKSNSRRVVFYQGKPRVIKSQKALDYLASLQKQVQPISPLVTVPIKVSVTIFYRTRRPDLDPSVILDGLQGRIYANDRQVYELWCEKRFDPKRPRAHVIIEPICRED